MDALLRTGDGLLFDSVVGQRVYTALRVLANPRDIPSRRRLVSPVAGEITAVYRAGLDEDPRARVLEELEAADLPPAIATPLRARLLGELDDEQLLRSLIDPGLSFDADREELELWRSDQAELLRCWRHYKIRTPEPARTLSGLLGALARIQRTTIDEPGVRLLTVHAAKGLEFRVVVLVGLNEGTFPYYRSLGSDDLIDDERRNVYVAVTRAARALRLSRPRVRKTAYGSRVQQPSRFLEEMDVTSS